MADDYDLIILGAGHNGLILQAYLCKAGLKVLAVDRAPIAGGGLTTLEDPALSGISPQHARLLSSRDHGDAVVCRPRTRAARRPLYRTRAQRLVVNEGRADPRMVDGLRADCRLVCAIQPARCRDFAALVRGIRSDRRASFAPRSDLTASARQTNAEPSLAAARWGGGFSKLAHYLHSNLCSRNSSIPPSRPACYSSMACARSTSASAASAIISQRCWLSRPKRKCRAVALPRLPARSKAPCGRLAVRSVTFTEPRRILVENGRAIGIETGSRRNAESPPWRRFFA